MYFFDFIWSVFSIFIIPELLFPRAVFADVSVQSVMKNFLDYFTSEIATLIATIAIIGLGIGCFLMGKISKTAFFTTFVGIALIFGASALVSFINK